MFRVIDKYRKDSSIIFLSAYFAFILISTIHHHHYNLNAENCFKSEQENSALALDFLSDGVTVCAVNHFAHSIFNFSYSSSDLFLFLPKLSEKISLKNLSTSSFDVHDLTFPRAPPIFS